MQGRPLHHAAIQLVAGIKISASRILNSAAPALDGIVASFVSYIRRDDSGMCSDRWRRGAVQRGGSANRLLLIKKLIAWRWFSSFLPALGVARAGRRGIVAVTGNATISFSKLHICTGFS